MNDGNNQLDLSVLREKLAGKTGHRYWRSLEEASDTPEFRRLLHNEFPAADASQLDDGFSRRGFLKVMGASLALAGLASCKRKVDETIVPYVRQPEGVTPGIPLYYATAMTLGGYAQGVIAESHEGRPTKLEGNPDQSASLGGSDVFMQGELLTMYDPDRAKVVKNGDSVKDWDSFVAAVRPRLEAKRKDGSAVRLLTETITSPSLLKQISDFKTTYPGAKWHVYDPLSRDNIRLGLSGAAGRQVMPHYDFATAGVIVSLDCDFLYEEPGHLRYARDFANARRISAGTTSINRLYVFESVASVTGSVADHRWALRPMVIRDVAAALANALGIAGGQAADVAGSSTWAPAIARDLQANAGKSLVIAGPSQPPEVHALVHAINQKLSNIGATVIYAAPVEGDADGTLEDLAGDMDRGAVDTLFIFGGNPAFTAPSDLNFAKKLNAFLSSVSNGTFANLAVRIGLYEDETTRGCHWHLPETHFLEQWGDARAYDGTISIIQPLIEPLYTGRSCNEVLALLTNSNVRRGYDIVRGFWAAQKLGGNFDTVWQQALEKGVLDVPTEGAAGATSQATTMPSALPATMPSSMPSPLSSSTVAVTPGTGAFDLVFRPDPNIRDGFYANNGWLQELPKPLTKLTWDNAALISKSTAAKLNVENGDEISIKVEGIPMEQPFTVPVWVAAGSADDVITLHMGYGRTFGGKVLLDGNSKPYGVNVYPLRTCATPWFVTGVQAAKTGDTRQLVAVHTYQAVDERKLNNGMLNAAVIEHPEHEHDLEHPITDDEAKAEIDNRLLIRVGTIEQFRDDPLFAKKMDETFKKGSLTLYPGYGDVYKNNFAWGMSIDVQTCIGCNACVIACQAENNIPVVGKDQVSRGREMHWIRIDTYFEGEIESPTAAYHQPIPCMQCENAPCELVCPVGATVHDNEGLNDMVYNRCVGTRYCSNNCPYKVRRFNFYQYTDQDTESLKLMRNPEVTVRSRGVMEKCTYCIQRITATRIEIEKIQVRMDEKINNTADDQIKTDLRRKSAEHRQKVLDGLQTACQQACPTQAIAFGNSNMGMEPIREIDPSHVNVIRKLKDHPLDYGLLDSLTNRPRTTYLARVQNPNDEIRKESRS